METNAPKKLPAMDVLRDGAILALVGWAGLACLINVSVPFLFPRWLFYFGLMIAATGTALPLVWYLNRRFSPEQFPHASVLWREGLETGVLITLLVWLQVGRILSAALGWIFFAVFLAVEILLRVYENSRWAGGDRADRSSTPGGAMDGSTDSIESPPLTQN